MPQSFGNYVNTAHLDAIPASAYYQVMRVARIVTTKSASTSFVEPGQSFNYIINVKNGGSVGFNNIKVEDFLPDCVTYNNGCSGQKLDASGNVISSVTPVCSPPNFNLPAAFTLQPGESVNIIINVTRKANDLSAECCDLMAKATAITTDAVAQHISDERGPACVKSGLCCDIKDVNVTYVTGNINGAIVPLFIINSAPLPIQEIDISLIDYHVEYRSPDCKPANMGNLLGHIQPFVGTVGGVYYDFNSLPSPGVPVLSLQTVATPVNNLLIWTGANPMNLSQASGWNFNGLIALNFVPPAILNLDCCSGTVYFCFKVRIKDVNCNVCEKIVCGSATIPKKKTHLPWISEEAKNKYEIQSLKNNNRQPLDKNEVNKNLIDYLKDCCWDSTKIKK